MELSVVIVNYRVKYLLEQTLRSVEQAMQGMTGEVIVVDNLASPSGSRILLELFISAL